MRFGVHVRIARGLSAAIETAAYLKCEAVQLFSANPNSWASRPFNAEQAAIFATRASALDIHPIILHTPYLVNLASPDGVVWRKRTAALAEAVAKAPQVGGSIVVTHIGSHKGAGRDYGIRRIAEAVKLALDAHPQPAIALELGAGAGNAVASRFEDAGDILESLGNSSVRAGVCVDTAHLWGAGYDLSTTESVARVFMELRRRIGYEKVLVMHLNDTLVDLGSHRDLHHHIGKGRIGIEGFRAIINHPALADLPGIIETPADDPKWDVKNLRTLRRLRAADAFRGTAPPHHSGRTSPLRRRSGRNDMGAGLSE